MNNTKKIDLSVPYLLGTEQKYIREAFDSNWVAPMGTKVDLFERDLKTDINLMVTWLH